MRLLDVSSQMKTQQGNQAFKSAYTNAGEKTDSTSLDQLEYTRVQMRREIIEPRATYGDIVFEKRNLSLMTMTMTMTTRVPNALRIQRLSGVIPFP